MRIGLAQINTIVGDLAGNRHLIEAAYKSLVAQGAELVVFPELAVCGYPPRDLLFKRRFVADVERATAAIAANIGTVPAVIGYTEANTTGQGRPAFNAAAFCHQGKIVVSARKCLLPTYDVFDEDRYFEPAKEPTVVDFNGHRIGLTICEDIWTHEMISTRRLYNGVDPVKWLGAQNVISVLNLSASPWNLSARVACGIRWSATPRGGSAARWPTSTPSAATTNCSSTAAAWWPTPTAAARRPRGVSR